MRIHKVEIKNFRGIKSFEHDFGSNNLVCFVGRGNSTKSTILEAISLCLSSRWNLNISDSDFHNCNVEEDIDISVTISDIPGKLINESKFGLYRREYDTQSKDFKDIDSPSETSVTTLTINLNVNASLEPEWNVISDNIDPKSISSRDRESLGVFLISDYTDNHFSWTKGSPLYTLQSIVSGITDESKNIVLDVIRKAKDSIEAQSFDQFDDILTKIKESVKNIGGDIGKSKASVDIKDIAFRSNTISLHSDNKVPIRMDGKGAKRIVSTAIQILLANNGSLLLVDEIEQGLEPDRIKHLIRTLECEAKGQVFLTTHSREVVEEVEASQIFIVENKAGIVSCTNKSSDEFQAVYRSCPEAVYANKVIICEGKTEIGFIRAYDKWRIKNNKLGLSSLGIVYSLGEGNSLFNRALTLNKLNKDVLVICDTDENIKQDKDGTKIKAKKQECKDAGISLIDWEEGNDIEHQIFKDLDWDSIVKLIEIGKHVQGNISVENELKKLFTDDLSELDTTDGRKSLADLATKGECWFKRIDRGEQMGEIVMESIDNIEESKNLKMKFNELNNWVDGNTGE